MNYVREDVTEFVFDGDGRPVREASGVRSYHISNPPSGSLTPAVTGYQVWSTVLGEVINTLTPAGALNGTKIFAGGAMIAGRTLYEVSGVTHENITFMTADPVTGTSAMLRYSSEFGNSAGSVENMEPLGQELYTSDPETFTPPGPDLSLRSADDPEWQCSAPHSFWGGQNASFGDLPTHCQQRMIEDLSFPLADAKKEKKESPTKLVDSPIRRFGIGNSPGETVMAYARTSSAKPSGDTGDDDADSGCDWDKDGRPDCAVTVTGETPLIDMSDTGAVDASISTGFDRNRDLVDKAINDVKKIFEGDNGCSRFFEQAFMVASEFEGQNRKLPHDGFIMPQYDARIVADALGEQLRNNIGVLRGDVNNTTTGIRMKSGPDQGITVHSGNLIYRLFNDAVVNSRGPFLSSGRFGTYNGRAGRALAILHEIAHMIRKGIIRNASGQITGYTYLIPDDGLDMGQSRTNTDTIEENCKTELNTLRTN